MYVCVCVCVCIIRMCVCMCVCMYVFYEYSDHAHVCVGVVGLCMSCVDVSNRYAYTPLQHTERTDHANIYVCICLTAYMKERGSVNMRS
jgi:hypothetical protein